MTDECMYRLLDIYIHVCICESFTCEFVTLYTREKFTDKAFAKCSLYVVCNKLFEFGEVGKKRHAE